MKIDTMSIFKNLIILILLKHRHYKREHVYDTISFNNSTTEKGHYKGYEILYRKRHHFEYKVFNKISNILSETKREN
jgi:hypothetical protein